MNAKEPKNPKLGTWTCPAGGTADVFQTKKRGRHFYTHCDCCGLNQGTGAARQQKIYDEASFMDKSAIVIPNGVNAGPVINNETPRLENKKVPVSDFDPAEPVPEGEQPAPEASEGISVSRILPGLIFLLAGAAGVWMS